LAYLQIKTNSLVIYKKISNMNTEKEQKELIHWVLKNKKFINAIRQVEKVLHKKGYDLALKIDNEHCYIEIIKLEIPDIIK